MPPLRLAAEHRAPSVVADSQDLEAGKSALASVAAVTEPEDDRAAGRGIRGDKATGETEG